MNPSGLPWVFNNGEFNEDEAEELTRQLLEHGQNKFMVKRLKKRIHTLNRIYFNAPTLKICGINHLRTTINQSDHSIVNKLFFDANLPQCWIASICPDNTTQPNTVYVTLITYHVKVFVQNILNHFLSGNPNTNISEGPML